jgi:hypothetical protein
MIMWIHPDLLPILKRRKAACFIDGTFRVVPRPFAQCVIVMIYDDETELYVPIVYSLVENKNEWTYWHLIHLVLVACELKFDPMTITTDFERPLMNAIKDQLRDAQQIGCLFHFKQAMHRKLTKLRIPDYQIQEAMRRGMLDELTVIKRDEISATITKIREKMVEGQHGQKWDAFFKYFETTWMNSYLFETWNISDQLQCGINVDNRTNNALENFNRQLNQEFPTAHPNIFHFITTIRDISSRYVQRIKDIRAGLCRHPSRDFE